MATLISGFLLSEGLVFHLLAATQQQIEAMRMNALSTIPEAANCRFCISASSIFSGPVRQDHRFSATAQTIGEASHNPFDDSTGDCETGITSVFVKVGGCRPHQFRSRNSLTETNKRNRMQSSG
jgi:hypothetical protein